MRKVPEQMAKKNHESDVTFIRELAVLLREHDLTELEVARDYGENDNLNVRVARQAQGAQQREFTLSPSTTEVPSNDENVKNNLTDPINNPGTITSPMVGTVYLAPEPGASEYSNIGKIVKEGDTLLIIEAMKTMNQVPSPRSGKITRILVDDGSAVEFGSPLLIIE
jgi:acetyl-CoA carboxylase biotin carboxyl carrier protein